ncbi:hypothetical protein [Saccharopolyspora gloriosae]|uniref:hypothetical protein n=1 Tax=Saccharopolyspora gloriosae TaxID=455344 RepID=UPI001FB67461|nr:hypothetical protein [Saccharopolyspora gloriosae]
MTHRRCRGRLPESPNTATARPGGDDSPGTGKTLRRLLMLPGAGMFAVAFGLAPVPVADAAAPSCTRHFNGIKKSDVAANRRHHGARLVLATPVRDQTGTPSRRRSSSVGLR